MSVRDHPTRITTISEPARLAVVVGDPSRLDDLDAAQLAALVLELSAIEARVASRLAQLGADRGAQCEDRLLDIKEAAGVLAVSPDWLRRRAGKLPFEVRVGGAVRFSLAGLQRWLARRTGARS